MLLITSFFLLESGLSLMSATPYPSVTVTYPLYRRLHRPFSQSSVPAVTSYIDHIHFLLALQFSHIWCDRAICIDGAISASVCHTSLRQACRVWSQITYGRELYKEMLHESPFLDSARTPAYHFRHRPHPYCWWF